MMEGVLFILIVFGGGMLVVISKTDIGRAIAERIRNEPRAGGADPELAAEVDRLRQEVAELHERVDFTERLLASQRDARQIAGE
jgi:hypothetical protein